MTFPDAFALDRWVLPTREPRSRDVARSRRLSDWAGDGLERAMLVAVVLLGAVLLWTLASAEDAAGMTAQDPCVVTAVHEAEAFAGVMGDDRVIPQSFAVRACALRS